MGVKKEEEGSLADCRKHIRDRWAWEYHRAGVEGHPIVGQGGMQTPSATHGQRAVVVGGVPAEGRTQIGCHNLDWGTGGTGQRWV